MDGVLQVIKSNIKVTLTGLPRAINGSDQGVDSLPSADIYTGGKYERLQHQGEPYHRLIVLSS
jgi:hypothetical protein